MELSLKLTILRIYLEGLVSDFPDLRPVADVDRPTHPPGPAEMSATVNDAENKIAVATQRQLIWWYTFTVVGNRYAFDAAFFYP